MKRVQSNELDFSGQNIYVGIDVHLKSWSVAILSEHSVLKRFSQSSEPEALHKYLVSNYPGANYFSVYEAGFCGFWIHERLTDLGIANIVVNPADVPTMSKEKLRKTDSVDCNKLARELRSGSLVGIYVPGVETLELRSLIRMRNLIVKDSTRAKNRIKSLLRFKNADHLASFIGLVPMCHSSGESNGTGDITVRRHFMLRCLLIEAAWIAIRKDPAMTVAYAEYRKRMNPQKSIVKIAGRLVNRIYYVLKHEREYIPCVVK